MCPLEIAIGAAAAGMMASAGATMYQADKQARDQKRIMRKQEQERQALLKQYKESQVVDANIGLRGLGMSDQRRLLARSQGGTAFTTLLDQEDTTPTKKKSLLGE